VAIVWGERYLGVGIFSSGLTGALLGFLLYNFHPAQVFMGDTGSLFLGGAVCGLAFAMDMPLIILVIGFVFVVEILSDVIQIGYYKLSRGKRVFRMAPLHHHLEMGGWTGRKWNEKELFVLVFTVSLACAVLAFAGTYNRFVF
jgi:phospho-N-acetylmuramoyl-pentapeptide-transferase